MKPKDLLPHGEAFLFVDEITKADAEEVAADFTFSPDHKALLFQEENAFVPPMLLVESIVQCGGAGVRQAGLASGTFLLAKVDFIRFTGKVKIGQKVFYQIQNVRLTSNLIVQQGKGYVEDVCVMEASWLTARQKKK